MGKRCKPASVNTSPNKWITKVQGETRSVWTILLIKSSFQRCQYDKDQTNRTNISSNRKRDLVLILPWYVKRSKMPRKNALNVRHSLPRVILKKKKNLKKLRFKSCFYVFKFPAHENPGHEEGMSLASSTSSDWTTCVPPPKAVSTARAPGLTCADSGPDYARETTPRI